jgi:SagB-type dehydrogenase family enzyme
VDEQVFELFWENTKLNAVTVRLFAERMSAHEPDGRLARLDYPGPDIPLRPPSDRLLDVMRRRRSGRSWSDRPLSRRQLSSLLVGLSASPHGTRLHPSAGSTQPLETYVLCHRVEDLSGTACHYNPDNHSLTAIRRLPSAAEYVRLLNLELEREPPQVTVVVAALTDRTTTRYGGRGGRFVLIEAGHAAQNLALRAAHERLVLVDVGGLLDDAVADLLDLRRLGGKVVLGVACGPG